MKKDKTKSNKINFSSNLEKIKNLIQIKKDEEKTEIIKK